MIRTTCSLLIVTGLLAGCSESTDSASAPVDATPPAADWLIQTTPVSYTQLAETKLDAVEGDTITVHGRIGGTVEPMMTEFASFIMADLKLQHCGQKMEDTCPTPWDYCCTPREELVAGTASVQLVDASGELMELDLTKHGFSPLDEIVVTGTVAERPSPEVFVIHATGIHRLRGG